MTIVAMEYQKTTLKNNLRLLTIPVPRAKSVTAMVMVGTGSRYETKQTNGISHFLEHMAFKGTEKRPSAFAISSLIDGIGGDFNAATGKEMILYYVKAASKHLPLALDVLSDILLRAKLDPVEIEKEKGVIIEEINLYEDMPSRRVGELFEGLLYRKSPLGWDIAGEKETIQKIQRQDFVQYLERFYHPQNMLVVIAGGSTKERSLALTEEVFGGLTKTGEKPQPKEKFTQSSPQFLLKTKKTDQAHLVLGVRGNPLGHKDRFVEAVLATILGGGMSSRLFIQVRERRGLAYYVRTSTEHYLDNGYLATVAGVNLKKAAEAVKVILEEYQKTARAEGISRKELTKAKEFIKGKLVLDLEDSRNLAGFYGTQELLEGRIENVSQTIEAVDKVTAEEIARVAKEFFTNKRLNLAIIGPYREKQVFEKVLKFS